MNRWVVIPIKAPAACKTRLATALDEQERERLVAAMLHHTVAAARTVVGHAHVLLLGPSRHGLDDSTPLLADPGLGLNAALASARDMAVQAGVGRLLLLSADLPTVRAEDVAALLDVPEKTVAGAPDRAGHGTNALSLPLPRAASFGFHYGEGSFAAHRKEAFAAALPFLEMDRPGLGLDIDLPSDIAALGGQASYGIQ